MRIFSVGLLFFLSVVLSARTYSHHSFATHYDTTQMIEITGTVSEISLRSPHSFYMLDVQDDQQTLERWEIEAPSIPQMRRAGIEDDTIRLGDTVTIKGPRSRRTGTNGAFGNEMTLADGSRFIFRGRPGEVLGIVPQSYIAQDSSVVQLAEGAVLDRLVGRWARLRSPASETPAPDGSPMPLNSAGLSARAAYDPRNTPAMRCVPPNVPSLLYAPYLYEIRAEGNWAVLHHEYDNISRPIALGDSTSVTSTPPEYGQRRSRIDGNALVVESTGFPDHAAGLASDWDDNGSGANVPASAQKRLVERYTVSEDGLILVLDYTLEDPVYLAGPYTARIQWRRLNDDAAIYEFDCDVETATRSTLNAPSLEPED